MLVAFDMDGVIFDIISSWVSIHRHFSTNNDASLRAYMDGKIDDHEFMRRDIRLWLDRMDPIEITYIRNILERDPLMRGAIKTLKSLKEREFRVGIISGGLDMLAWRVSREVELDFIRINSLETDDAGHLTGEGVLNVRLRDKATPLREIQTQFGIPVDRTVSIGNSSIDASMFTLSGLSIAFDPCDDIVREAADVIIDSHDLRDILPSITAWMER